MKELLEIAIALQEIRVKLEAIQAFCESIHKDMNNEIQARKI